MSLNPFAEYKKLKADFLSRWFFYRENLRPRAMAVGATTGVSEADGIGARLLDLISKANAFFSETGLGVAFPVIIGGVALGAVGIVGFFIVENNKFKAKVKLIESNVLSAEDKAKVVGDITRPSGGLLGDLGLKTPLTVAAVAVVGILLLDRRI